MTDNQKKMIDDLYQKRKEYYYFNYAGAINEIINNSDFIDEKFIEVLLYEAFMGQLLICKKDFLVVREGYDSFFSKRSLNFYIRRIIRSKFISLNKDLDVSRLLLKYPNNKEILEYSIRINPSLSTDFFDKIDNNWIKNILYLSPNLISSFDDYKSNKEIALICMINDPNSISYFNEDIKKDMDVLKCAFNNIYNECRVGNLTDEEVYKSKNYLDTARQLLLKFEYEEENLTDEFIISLSIGMLTSYDNEEIANETLALENYFDEYIDKYLGVSLKEYENKVQI